MLRTKKTIALLMTASILISSTLAFMPITAALPGMDTTIASVASGKFVGENDNDNAGSAISSEGDLNGDGYADIVIASSTNSEGGAASGQVYIMWGRAGNWNGFTNLGNADASFLGTDIADSSGTAIDSSGDLNGDGLDDMVISSPTNSDTDTQAGKVSVVFGQKNASTAWTKDMDLETVADATFLGEYAFDQLGMMVSTAGDVNNDGIDDLLIGAPGFDATGADAGKAYLILGRTSPWTKGANVNNSSVATFLGQSAGDGLGLGCALVRDLNGDLYDDVVLGAWGDNHKANNAGQVFIMMGRASGWAKPMDLSAADASYVGDHANDALGLFMSSAGNVNGDGFNDLLISSEYSDVNGANSGMAYLLLGKASGWAMDQDITTADAAFNGVVASEQAGRPCVGVGDINRDGLDDMMISSMLNDEAGVDAGQVYIVFGNKTWSSTPKSLDLANASFLGADVGGNLGWALGGGGDVNGDGIPDLLMSATGSSGGSGTSRGVTYLVKFDHTHAPDAVTVVKAYSEPTFVSETHFAYLEDTLYLELQGEDANATTIDMDSVMVSSTASPVGFRMALVETSNNSGLYHGQVQVKNMTRKDQGWIKASVGDRILISSFQNSSKNTTVTIGLLELSPSLDLVNATEDLEYSSHYNYTNITGPIWDFDTNASWLDLNETTQNLTGTPHNQDVGTFWVMLNLSDEFGRYVAHQFNITVNNTPPNITTQDVGVATEDLKYEVQYNCTDDGQGNISWTLVTNTGAWLSFNKSSQILEGVPSNEDAGTFWVNITVNDGNGGTDFTNFTLEVQNVNDPPHIVGVDKTTAYEDKIYQTDYDVVDPDVGAAHMWTLETNATWLHLSLNYGVLSGLPTNTDVGSYWVNLTVTDYAGAYDQRNFTLTVLNVNDPPYWVDVPDTLSLGTDEVLDLQVVAQDDDLGDNSLLRYSLETDPASTAAIGAVSGRINWTPGNVGVYDFNVTVTDGNATIFHHISVIVVFVNSKPVASLSAPADKDTTASARPQLRWIVQDPDGDDVVSDLYLSPTKTLVEAHDNSVKFASVLGASVFTPTKDLVPGTTYYWTVVPFDGTDFGSCSNGPFQFKVSESAPINHAPTIVQIEDKKVQVGKALKLTLSAQDQDVGDNLTFALASGPAGMNLSAKGVLTWTPSKNQVGNYSVTVTVSDGEITALMSFNVQVEKAPAKIKEKKMFGTGTWIAVVLLVLLALVVAGLVFGGKKDGPKDEKDVAVKPKEKDEGPKGSEEE
jgi:hypothetical protein